MATRIIVVGNPGAGKSTLLNTVIGKSVFKSGMSIGHGIMPTTRSHTILSTTYVDTPGLADVEFRDKAAEYISSELSKGGLFKLFFVIKTDDLNVQYEDLATIELVLNAISERGYAVNGRYSIIVNQLFPAELEAVLGDDETNAKLVSVINATYKTESFAWVPLEMESKNKSDQILKARLELLEYFLNAPCIQLKPQEDITVSSARFDDTMSKAKQHVAQLEQKKGEQTLKMKEQDEQFVQAEQMKKNLEALKQQHGPVQQNPKQQKNKSLVKKIVGGSRKTIDRVVKRESVGEQGQENGREKREREVNGEGEVEGEGEDEKGNDVMQNDQLKNTWNCGGACEH